MGAARHAQDPNRHRSNETYPKVAADEHAAPSVQGGHAVPGGAAWTLSIRRAPPGEAPIVPPPSP